MDAGRVRQAIEVALDMVVDRELDINGLQAENERLSADLASLKAELQQRWEMSGPAADGITAHAMWRCKHCGWTVEGSTTDAPARSCEGCDEGYGPNRLAELIALKAERKPIGGQNMEAVIIPAKTVVHISGIPVALAVDTLVETTPENMPLLTGYHYANLPGRPDALLQGTK